SALLGFPLRPESSMLVVAASLPFMVVYPLALSAVMYALAHRVAQQNRQLERLNRIDVLTGLPNRRHWDEVAGSELARYLRSRRPAVVMLIDVDNFKEVNDAHGHATGDEVLRCVAQVLRGSVREIDTPARYGGDEFVVLLTETDVRGAREVAERVRIRFLEARGEAAAAARCTLSIGLAQADRLLVNADDWIRRADAAMYGAKAGGRDRVNVPCTAPGPRTVPTRACRRRQPGRGEGWRAAGRGQRAATAPCRCAAAGPGRGRAARVPGRRASCPGASPRGRRRTAPAPAAAPAR